MNSCRLSFLDISIHFYMALQLLYFTDDCLEPSHKVCFFISHISNLLLESTDSISALDDSLIVLLFFSVYDLQLVLQAGN